MHEMPTPPGAAEFSELVKNRLTEVRDAGGTRETVTVDWHGQPLHVDVIDVPLRELYFNPVTHRIRAQRSYNPTLDEALDTEPFSERSQDYLRHLLQASPSDPDRRDTEFTYLLESLKDFGQNEPGLITHQGVLVNGNTRAAALREIGAQTMRVGVLPASFEWADIVAIELSLQLRPDNRRDYSYINRLLAMEEQAELGRSPEVVAKEFRIRVATYEQERWILGVIRDQIERSKANGSGPALRLIDFEEQQEKLKEVHRAYNKLYSSDPDQAEALKEMRLAAINLGLAKTAVRAIEDGTVFRHDYLDRRLPKHLVPEDVAGEAIEVPGLGLTVSATIPAVAAARALNDQVLKAKAAARGNTESAATIEASATFSQLKDAFDHATDVAERQGKLKKRRQLASERLTEASLDIEQCVADFAQARASRSLDEESFDDALLKLRASLRKLAKQVGRGIQNPGDGVAWLHDAASSEGPK